MNVPFTAAWFREALRPLLDAARLAILDRLDVTSADTSRRLSKLEMLMSQIDDAIQADAAALAALKTSVDAVAAKVGTLATRVADLTAQLAAAGVSPETLAAAQALATGMNDLKAELDAAASPPAPPA